MLKLCQSKKKEPNLEKFSLEVVVRLKKAKKLFWLKKKKNNEEKMKNTYKMIVDLIASSEPENQEISKDILELLSQQTKEHDISEIPDYFLCKINYVLYKIIIKNIIFSLKEPLKSPFLTMDGITYEKQSLIEHFQKVGYFDPLTRRDLDPMRIIENKNLVDAFDYFIEKNPWAFEYFDSDGLNNDFTSIEL